MTSYDVLSAIPTSFDTGGAVDLEGSRAIFRHVAASGNEGAFLMGTTGEFPAVTTAEFDQLIGAALEELANQMRVVVHVGAASVYEALARVRSARAAGATEFAALTPYYLSASDEEIHDYFTRVAAEVGDGRLYIYIYPARSGNQVSPELLGRLAELGPVVGAKVSEMRLEDLARYRDATPEAFELYTGADRDLAIAGRYGARGVVSGVSAVLPRPFRALAEAARSGDEAGIATAQSAVDDVTSVIGGNMARMKAAYRIMGVADGTCRMAISPPGPADLAEIERVVATHR